jgi:hypothetical protein
MKKIVVVTALIAMILTACGNSNSSSQNGNFPSTSNQNFAGNRTLSDESKYALGILKLEGSTQAVDSTLAVKLLPYWQLMKELNSNNSAAPEEFTAVVDQIKGTLSPDQVKAIDDMQLTQRDIFTVLQADGAISSGFQGNGQNSGNSTGNNTNRTGNDNQTSGNGFRPNGGFPGGGGPGFNPGTNGQNGNSQQQTAQVEAARNNRFATLLVDQVIKILSGKIQG